MNQEEMCNKLYEYSKKWVNSSLSRKELHSLIWKDFHEQEEWWKEFFEYNLMGILYLTNKVKQ